MDYNTATPAGVKALGGVYGHIRQAACRRPWSTSSSSGPRTAGGVSSRIRSELRRAKLSGGPTDYCHGTGRVAAKEMDNGRDRSRGDAGKVLDAPAAAVAVVVAAVAVILKVTGALDYLSFAASPATGSGWTEGASLGFAAPSCSSSSTPCAPRFRFPLASCYRPGRLPFRDLWGGLINVVGRRSARRFFLAGRNRPRRSPRGPAPAPPCGSSRQAFARTSSATCSYLGWCHCSPSGSSIWRRHSSGSARPPS